MQYGRTLLELFVVQALILTAFLVVPMDLLASAGIAGGTALASVVACALYVRHRGRAVRDTVTAAAEVPARAARATRGAIA